MVTVPGGAEPPPTAGVALLAWPNAVFHDALEWLWPVLALLALAILDDHASAPRPAQSRRTVGGVRVEDFHPPWRLNQNRTTRETFKVYSLKQDFRYSYLESDLAPGFNPPSDRGGPIREGLRVHLT